MERKTTISHPQTFLISKVAPTLALSIALAGCVSVNIGPKGAERSAGVSIREPSSPFAPIKGSRADAAWLNSNNGNTISYLSTCDDPSDPSIDIAAREMMSALRDPVIVRSEDKTFNGREALDTEIEGKAEGVATRIRSLVFKKNNCLYTISMVGIAKSFDQDRSKFDDFLNGFHAP